MLDSAFLIYKLFINISCLLLWLMGNFNFNGAEDSLNRESGNKVHYGNIQASKVEWILVSLFAHLHLLMFFGLFITRVTRMNIDYVRHAICILWFIIFKFILYIKVWIFFLFCFSDFGCLEGVGVILFV